MKTGLTFSLFTELSRMCIGMDSLLEARRQLEMQRRLLEQEGRAVLLSRPLLNGHARLYGRFGKIARISAVF